MINEIILLVVLLLLSGFFSSAETAMFSISNTKIRHLAKEGKNTDILIERMKKNSHRLLTTILIGNNVVFLDDIDKGHQLFFGGYRGALDLSR